MRFPEGQKTADVLETAAMLRDEADRRIQGRLDGTRQRGQAASCTPGCTACCRQLVVISPIEALAIAQFTRTHRSVASRLPNALTAWEARIAAAEELSRQMDGFDAADGYVSGADGGRLEFSYWREQIPCPFLDNGHCSIYPVRPFACREHYVTSDPRRCAEDLDSATPAGTRMEYRSVAGEVGVRCYDLPDRIIPLGRCLDYAADHLDELQRTAPTEKVVEETEGVQRRTRLALAIMTHGRLTQS